VSFQETAKKINDLYRSAESAAPPKIHGALASCFFLTARRKADSRALRFSE
jgi:hypothetical protein